MTRSSALKAINPILAVLLANQLLTGFFADSLSRDSFEVLHQGGGILLAIVAALHLILNWSWVRATFFHRA